MRASSIRTRVLLASVILVTIGLLVADGATYTLLRSSLLSRIDQQLLGARFGAARALSASYGPGDLGGGQPGAQVAYAQALDRSGTVVAGRSFGFGDISYAPPVLPSGLPGVGGRIGGNATRFFTASAESGPVRYRVLANALQGGGSLIVAIPLTEAEATLHRLTLVEALVTIGVVLALAVLATWAIRMGLRPLARIEEAAADIAAGDLSRRVEPADAGTEIGRLGLALNAMMEKIEAAFSERREAESKLRRFIADASHELRTPLTSIRGYAELFRRGAGERPGDLEKSMSRIEEEASRMGSMVDELLLLARLDQGRPLERAPVDLVAIAADAVADARAIQPDRPIAVSASAERVVVDGDEARLRQVVANLLTNALVHTPLDAPVHVDVSATEHAARIGVVDEGPGLAPEVAARVFDRFYRLDESRSRESGGAGLGLSIVEAIVQAHGGSVSVESEPGSGARFVVTLPLVAPAGSNEDRSGEPAQPATE